MFTYSQFFASTKVQVVATGIKDPVYVKDWDSYAKAGILTGNRAAPVQVIEFSDFECPYCAAFHARMDTVVAEYPGQIAVSFVHFPLDFHRFAMPAATAAECAKDQGRFPEMTKAIFAKQDSFGLKTWESYAKDAGVPSAETFSSCMTDGAISARVEQGRESGKKLGVDGTPTVLFNGWRLDVPPPTDSIRRIVRDIVNGRNAFEGKE